VRIKYGKNIDNLDIAIKDVYADGSKFDCTNENIGSDPDKGQRKECFMIFDDGTKCDRFTYENSSSMLPTCHDYPCTVNSCQYDSLTTGVKK
jgi:hypothetical protein